MEQSDIDALMAKGVTPSTVKAPKNTKIGKITPLPRPVVAANRDDPQGQVISELDAVTAVTERETNKIMDQLDLISSLVSTQQILIADVMRHSGAQDSSVQEALHLVLSAGKKIQANVHEAMDLMQFQDITRQKLERIVSHLSQIHDYIVDLLGTGLTNNGERVSISRTIVSTGTTPEEQRSHADSVVEAFKRSLNKD